MAAPISSPCRGVLSSGEATLYALRNTPLGVPTKPRGLMVVVSAPKEKPEKVKELLGRVDLEKLNALLP